MAILRFNIIYDRKSVATAEKTSVIEFRFSCQGKQKYLSTGIKVRKNQWKGGKVVAHPEAKEQNKQLSILKIKANSIIEKAFLDSDFNINCIPFLFKGEEEEKENVDFILYCEKRRMKRKVCDATKKHYSVFIKFLKSWGKVKTFDDISVSKIRALDELLHRRGLEDGTIYNYHKYFKLFINDAVIDGLVSENPYKKIPFKIARGGKQYVDCLTEGQFNMLKKINPVIPHIKKAWHLFLLKSATCNIFDKMGCSSPFYQNSCVKTVYDALISHKIPLPHNAT